jgi:hypothetical protein
MFTPVSAAPASLGVQMKLLQTQAPAAVQILPNASLQTAIMTPTAALPTEHSVLLPSNLLKVE